MVVHIDRIAPHHAHRQHQQDDVMSEFQNGDVVVIDLGDKYEGCVGIVLGTTLVASCSDGEGEPCLNNNACPDELRHIVLVGTKKLYMRELWMTHV